MSLTYADLRNQTGEPGPHPFLYCPNCGERFSANAGDYFWANGSEPIQHCDEPMILAHERVSIIPVAESGR